MVGPLGLVRDCLRSGRPVALATVIELSPEDGSSDPLPLLGAKLALGPSGEYAGSMGDVNLNLIVEQDAGVALESGRSVTRHYGPLGEPLRTEITVYIEVFGPVRKMLIFGAADFTAALVKVAKVLGYHVIVCDARTTFATKERFPEADEVIADWPQRYLATVADTLGPTDAVCVLTHDHKFDIPALVGALKTNVGYIGAMGSRRTHDIRIEMLQAEGVDPQGIRRVMSPIGLDIGARTPEDTAIAICAEIIAVRAGADAPSLRDASGPIHRVAS
jgi:xanthine dehydrogenase accessory factor